MRLWPWSRSSTRASTGHAVGSPAIGLTAAQYYGTADEASLARNCSTVAAVAELMGAAFAGATVEGERAEEVWAEHAYTIGSRLVTDGEYIAHIDAPEGVLLVTEASGCDITGGVNPASWEYTLMIAGPDGNVERTLPAEAVLHCRWAWDAKRPWQGVPGWARCRTTAATLGLLDRSLRREYSGPVGTVAFAGGDLTEDLMTDLSELMNNLSGEAAVMSLTDAGGQAHQLGPTRIGPMPPASTAALRDALEGAILNAYGVPRAMLSEQSSQANSSDAKRFRSAIQSRLNRVAGELSQALMEDVTLTASGFGGPGVLEQASAWARLMGAAKAENDLGIGQESRLKTFEVAKKAGLN